MESAEFRRLASLFDIGPGKGVDFRPFHRYLVELIKWNSRINLTAHRSPEEMIEYNFLDSLVLLPIVSRGTMADIGSGAGFPGLVLKIAKTDLDVTLFESTRKKADFLSHIARMLGLEGVAVKCRRISPGMMFGSYDYIVGRATVQLETLIRISLPNLTPDGRIIALKGPSVHDEIGVLRPILNQRGLEIHSTGYTLPRSGRTGQIVTIAKKE